MFKVGTGLWKLALSFGGMILKKEGFDSLVKLRYVFLRTNEHEITIIAPAIVLSMVEVNRSFCDFLIRRAKILLACIG